MAPVVASASIASAITPTTLKEAIAAAREMYKPSPARLCATSESVGGVEKSGADTRGERDGSEKEEEGVKGGGGRRKGKG